MNKIDCTVQSVISAHSCDVFGSKEDLSLPTVYRDAPKIRS